MIDPLRHHRTHNHLHSPLGEDKAGRAIEKFARALGTPAFVILGALAVVLWITVNRLGFVSFDRPPFILLNLVFSAQAFFAGSFILIASLRQASRDKAREEADAAHREEIAQLQIALLKSNTEITEQIKKLTDEVHAQILATK